MLSTTAQETIRCKERKDSPLCKGHDRGVFLSIYPGINTAALARERQFHTRVISRAQRNFTGEERGA